jgi:hypothetical protein
MNLRPDPLARLLYVNQWQTQEFRKFQCLDNSHEELIEGYREINSSRGF